ncbi:MAG: zinc-ribbon domain-containing protein [candidate division WOR-3 bacterium]|nr:MAG: zinc-ribbon domain-containing protein [candidate division WOR-3 bacterium]
MIVECSGCKATYNIDEKKIPSAGVKVRCKKCGGVIYIRRPSSPPPATETPTKKASYTAPAPVVEPKVDTGSPSPPVVEKPPSMDLPRKAEAERKAVEESVERKVHLSEEELSEEDKKWHARARRLAKALASDLVLYNKARVEQGLKDGTIAELLGPEIRRSWDYYCQQIPKHIVESTDYFKEQLNTIVGKGTKIFK